jgi:subtilisin family serine protease
MKTSIQKFSFFVVLSVFAAFLVVVAFSTPARAEKDKDSKIIPGQYIVVFKDNVANPDSATTEIESKHKLGHLYSYRRAFKGFTATISDTELNSVKNDPRVAFISEDRIVTALDSNEDSVGVFSSHGSRMNDFKQQRPSKPAQVIPTGVARINAVGKANKGAGVNVAVIDTGIDLKHPDLAANIAGGVNCSSGTSYQDGNGHGTHVAGTIAALDNTIGVVGVAPQAKLWAVRVLNNSGSGTWSSVICGIDFVTAHASTIKVANMSLGGMGTSDNNCGLTNSDALHAAICRSRDAGVTYVVAAGNGDAYGNPVNASGFVPAAYDDAVVTVSALADSDGKAGGVGAPTSYGADDTFASFSNYGNIVDIGAPGVNIYSTWVGGGYNTISGTSMAAPHVTGSAALYIATHPGAMWTQVRDALVTLGEPAGSGHTNPTGFHPEPIVKATSL